MATACWAFIVAKSTPLETAPLLDSRPLQCANSKIYQQLIHKVLWMAWGYFQPTKIGPSQRAESPSVPSHCSEVHQQSGDCDKASED